MLVSLKEILPRARSKGYAVGAFNVSNIEGAQSVIAAAVKLKSPVILQTSEKALDYAGFEPLKSALLSMIEAVKIPVVLHLDHGRTVKIAKKCLDAGWSSVMIDASRKPFRENVFETGAVVKYARKKKASVEGELGPILGQEDYISGGAVGAKKFLTDPEHARIFAEQTGVDAFAPSLGLAHGVKIKKEKLDLKRLKAISEIVPTPLVLHGASRGTTDKEIKAAIKLGIAKINIDTHLRLAWNAAIRTFLKTDKDVFDPRVILMAGSLAVEKAVEEKIMLFGSAGRA